MVLGSNLAGGGFVTSSANAMARCHSYACPQQMVVLQVLNCDNPTWAITSLTLEGMSDEYP